MNKMVQNNLETQSFFNKLLLQYCNKLEIEPPLLLFNKQLELIGGSNKENTREYKSKLGISWQSGNIETINQSVIWLNLDNSDCLWQLIDVLIHEICHLKWPYLEEDDMQEKVNSVILGRRY